MRLLFLFFLLLVLIPGTVLAQQDDNDMYQLETVSVTAEKREQDAQKVSIPMNIMSETMLEDSGIRKITDLNLYLPNIHMSQGGIMGDTEIVFRGLAPSIYSYTNSLVMVVDGLTIDSQKAFDINFEDVERIEFLRGPQGTLYGKNAAAGVLNITTRQPGNEIDGKISLGLEEHNTYYSSFRVSGPVREDRLFFGLSGSYESTDGWMEDHTPGGKEHMDESENSSIGAKLLFTPGMGNSVTLKYGYSRLDGNNPPITDEKHVTFDTITGSDDYQTDHTSHTLNLKMDFERSAFTFSSITSYLYAEKDDKTYVTSPMYLYTYYREKLSSLSQEFRLSSPESSKIRWIGGVYADRTVDDWTDDGDGTGMVLDLSVYSMDPMDIRMNDKKTITTLAAFGEMTFPLYKDKLSLTLGSRYEQVQKEFDFKYSAIDYTSGAELPFDYAGSPVPIEYSLDDKWNVFLGKAALNLQATENTLFYLTAAQGYIPGGYNWASTDPAAAGYNETHTLDFELGFKTSLLDKRLSLNVNLFYTDYKDLQTYQYNALGSFEVSNAGEAHATGIEADFAARPAPGWDIYGSAGYLKTEYDDYKSFNSTTMTMEDYTGNNITDSPELSASIGTKYRHSSGLFGLAEYSYIGKTYFTYGNESEYTRDAFDTVNLRAGYESRKGFEIYVYVKNALDEEYFSYIHESSNFGAYVVGQPRTIGVQASYRF